MIVILLMFCLILYIALRNPILGKRFPDIYEIQKEIHNYSGLDKSLYTQYLEEMDATLTTLGDTPVAERSLYAALDHLRSMGLTLSAGDSEIPDLLNGLADRLGKTTEKYIMKYALQNGNRFNPRYLNNTFINIRE
jgi:hypothetical protein